MLNVWEICVEKLVNIFEYEIFSIVLLLKTVTFFKALLNQFPVGKKAN